MLVKFQSANLTRHLSTRPVAFLGGQVLIGCQGSVPHRFDYALQVPAPLYQETCGMFGTLGDMLLDLLRHGLRGVFVSGFKGGLAIDTPDVHARPDIRHDFAHPAVHFPEDEVLLHYVGRVAVGFQVVNEISEALRQGVDILARTFEVRQVGFHVTSFSW